MNNLINNKSTIPDWTCDNEIEFMTCDPSELVRKAILDENGASADCVVSWLTGEATTADSDGRLIADWDEDSQKVVITFDALDPHEWLPDDAELTIIEISNEKMESEL